MERLLAVWVPEVATETDDGSHARSLVALVDEIVTLCPFVEPVRWGLVVLPMRGPSRFFGGEDVVVEIVRSAVQRSTGHVPRLGAADGLFSAFAAARREIVVPVGESDAFRRSLPITALERRELATVCRRLGVHTVGAFADLPAARVAERFTRDALHVHRVARGEESELRGQRDLRMMTRLQALRGENSPVAAQGGFFGDHRDADRRAAVAAHRVRQRLGPHGITTATLHGGRTPHDRATLVPYDAHADVARLDDEPWPGRIPSPAPSTTFAQPVAVHLLAADATPVRVEPRGFLSATPHTIAFERGATRQVAWHAGPWISVERWWSTRRRRAHLQIVTDREEAFLLCAERGSWWLTGMYD